MNCMHVYVAGYLSETTGRVYCMRIVGIKYLV